MIPRRSTPLLTAAALLAAGLAAPSLHADQPAPSAAPTVPLSATSQCDEGPGAPPADPSKVTRVPANGSPQPAAAAPAEEPAIDAPGEPDRILLELGANLGASVRLNDSPELTTANRAGLALGGSMLLWPSRSIGAGVTYTFADLSSSTTPPLSPDVIHVQYGVHALMAEVRAAPFRLSPSLSLFAVVGGGLAWQTGSLQATLAPIGGSSGGSITCGFGSNAELAFRAGLGLKARLGRAGAVVVDGTFTGYHLSSEVIGDCWYGTGTAETLMLRAGLAYDLDVTRVFR